MLQTPTPDPNPGWPPTPKMAASGISGALTVILIWACRQFFKLEIPPEIASAVTVTFGFVAGYFAPRSPSPTPTESKP